MAILSKWQTEYNKYILTLSNQKLLEITLNAAAIQYETGYQRSGHGIWKYEQLRKELYQKLVNWRMV